MVPPDSILKWQFRLDNPTFLGWSVVAAYIGAALCCLVAASRMRTPDGARRFAPVWLLLAVGLLFLGINKQLNLQTLLIVLGRRAAVAGHWYARRRQVQLIFSVVFGLGLVVLLFCLAAYYREFLKRNGLLFWGLVVLAVFVALRAATINHADQFLRLKLKDDHWAWLLEIAGSTLIAFAALTGSRTGDSMATQIKPPSRQSPMTTTE